MKISYGNTIKSNKLSMIELDNIITITNGDHSLKLKIDELRQLETDQERKVFKIAHLPIFSMGKFTNDIRKKENLLSIKTLILDIDHLVQCQLEPLKDQLKTDQEIFFFFTSPSGHGLKVAIELDQEINDPDAYECVYRSYGVLFAAKYGVEVDMHACDCSRACFLSYDEDLYLNENRQQIITKDWLATYENVYWQQEVPGKVMDHPDNLSAAIQFLINKNMVTGEIYNDYRNWQLLGLSLAAVGETGRQHFLDLSLSNTKYQDTENAVNAEYDKLLKYYGQSTKQPVSIGTLYHIALQHGYVFPANKPPDQPVSPTPAGLPVSNRPKTLQDELLEIAALTSEAEQDIKLKALVISSGASIRSLKNDMKALIAEKPDVVTTGEKIILAHPSYHVCDDFLVIGFQETVIVNNNPEDRNLFLVADGSNYYLTGEKFLKLDNTRIIFDMRGRETININDRWSRDALDNFIAKPEAPIKLYLRIKAVLKQYVYFQKPEHYGIVAAWIIATYFHRNFYAFLYLFFFGKKQTAKSRGLELLERLAFNAVKVKGSSVASFVDTIDGLRGAYLIDQAESLSDKNNTEILGYHADSYTVGGGKRRIVQTINGHRKVLVFESYGPKAYAAQKDVDPDLRDRCVVISMIRTKKDYPYPAAHLPIWAELRNDLYRLMLTKWQEVQKIYPETGKDVYMRIRELWRPLHTVLKLENVPDKEIEGIKKAFLESMALSQDGLTDKELFLIEALLNLTVAKKDDPKGVSLSASDIAIQMAAAAKAANTDLGFDKDRAMHTWIGFAIKRLSLFTGKDNNKNPRKHSYIFNHSHVVEIFDRFKEKTDGEDVQPEQPVAGTESAESNQEEIFPDQMVEYLKGMMEDFTENDTGLGQENFVITDEGGEANES